MAFKYDDLQPHVEMLIEALENKGACASGFPYAAGVAECATKYKVVLEQIRNQDITEDQLVLELQNLHQNTLHRTGPNQLDRVKKIVDALDSYMKKEYIKHS